MNQRSTLFDSVKGIAIFGIMFIHLGSWLLKPEEGSTFATLTTAGLLGVELTFIVNAYFLAKHFDKYRYEKLVHRNVLSCAFITQDRGGVA